MFFTRMVLSLLGTRVSVESTDRLTPFDSKNDFVSWIMCVSAKASFTAALSDSGLRISAFEMFIRSAIDETTASLYTVDRIENKYIIVS